jgi:hypothetical protein
MRRRIDLADLPPGLLDDVLEGLQAGAAEPPRRHEMDRVRRRLRRVSLDDAHLLRDIATSLIEDQPR